ncbi:MAG: DMT family transporter [Deltaproteobacteria bacterium]|nr:DMT family transporter [Deltaproteobacteria bacterium]
MASPPRYVYAFLAIGLVAASQSGNLVRVGDAHPAVMAAWRLLLASLIMAALAGPRLRELAGLSRTEKWLAFLAGAALSAHLMTWIAAVQRTTVANAAIFFSTNPVITAIAAHLIYGERITLRLFASVVLGLAGVAVIGLDDFHLSAESASGDAFSLLCSFFFTAYFMFGKRVRAKLDNRAYVTAVYGSAALCSFAAAAALGLPVLEQSARNWLCFVLLAIIPTSVGHTALNAALRYMDASRISAATLSEPVLAGLVAWWAWGEAARPSAFAGYSLIACSVVVLVWDEFRGVR